jgi:predicted TIM-barrel fold metal-dependent hydrolase
LSVTIGTATVPVIDFHTHIYPDALAPRVMEAFKKYPIEVFADGTLGGCLEHMEKSGVGTGVVLPVPTKPSQVESINDFMRMLLTEDRLVPFAGVHPAHHDPVEGIRKAAEDGCKGIKLHPLMQDFHPQEMRMFPLYDAAREEGMIILMHTGAGMDYDAIRGSKEDFDELFEHYDYDRFVLAHLGGREDFQQFPAFKSGWPGYLDLALSFGLMPDNYLVELVRDFGTDRVLFGTDSPWHSAERDLANLLVAGFTEQELQQILYKNATHLLGFEH